MKFNYKLSCALVLVSLISFSPQDAHSYIFTLEGPTFIPGCPAHHVKGYAILTVDDDEAYDSAVNIYVHLILNVNGALLDTAGEANLTQDFDRLNDETWGGGPYIVSSNYASDREYCVEMNDNAVLKYPYYPNLDVSFHGQSHCHTSPPPSGGQAN